MVTEDMNDKGDWVVHCPNGDEVYPLTKIPSATMYLVEKAKGTILLDLGLQSVLTDLNRASDLLFLAYLGVVGTGELQARISTRQKELAEVCGDCVVTMTALKDASLDVLDRLKEAYGYLLDTSEKRALLILSRCTRSANAMSSKCGELANTFRKLKDDTKEDAATATTAWNAHSKKVKELQELRSQMEATLAEQAKLAEEYNSIIKDLKDEIHKAQVKEDVADQRAFFAQIVSVVANVAGGAGSSVAMIMKMFQPAGDQARGSQEASLGGPSAEQLRNLGAEKDKAQKGLDEAKTAEDAADSKATGLERQVFDAKADKQSKEELLKLAKDADKSQAGYEDKVEVAKRELKDSSATLSKLEEDIKQAKEDAQKTKKKVDATTEALKAATAALANLEKSAGEAAKQQTDRATQLGDKISMLIQKKLEMERNRLASISQVAALTSRLGSNTAELQMEESAQTALYIATFALDNIYASLLTAKSFWDNMKSFCEKLADPKLLEAIHDEIDYDEPEKRIKAYKSKPFVEMAVDYLVRWAALASVCQDYVAASSVARKSVLGHIRASPDEKEARKLIGPLKAQLDKELAQDAAAAGTRIHKLEDSQNDAGKK